MYRIVWELMSFEEGKDKKVWILMGWGQGLLQVKVGVFFYFYYNMFLWLDDVFGIGVEQQLLEFEGIMEGFEWSGVCFGFVLEVMV